MWNALFENGASARRVAPASRRSSRHRGGFRAFGTAAFKRRPLGKCVSQLSTAAFAARTAVERVQTGAERPFRSRNALPVDAFHDLLDLGLFDGEVGDVEAVHDLL